jgi:hypothetical protein
MSVLDGAFEAQVKKQAHQWRMINDQMKILKTN